MAIRELSPAGVLTTKSHSKKTTFRSIILQADQIAFFDKFMDHIGMRCIWEDVIQSLAKPVSEILVEEQLNAIRLLLLCFHDWERN